MSSHNDNTRLNSLTSNEESTLTEVSASNDAIVDAPSRTNATAFQFSETVTLIRNLEKKMTSRFDGLDIELLNFRCNYQKSSNRERASQKKSKCP